MEALIQRMRGVAGRILVIYLVVFVVFGIGIVLSNSSLRQIGSNTDVTVAVQVPQIQLANEVKAAILTQQVAVQQYISRENPVEAKLAFRKEERLVEDRIKKLRQLGDDKVQQQYLEKVVQEYEEFTQVVNTIFKLDPGRATITTVLRENYIITAGNINKIVDDYTAGAIGEIASFTGETNGLIEKSTRNNLLIGFVAVVAGLVATGYLSMSISRPINHLVEAIGRFASGDLTQKVEHRGITEFETLGRSFNKMADNISQLVSQIVKASKEVNTSSEHMTSSAESVSQAAQEMAAGMETVVESGDMQTENMEKATALLGEISAAIENIAHRVQLQAHDIETSLTSVKEIAAMAEDVNSKAVHLKIISDDIAQTAESGSKTVSKAVSGMDGIKEIVISSSKSITNLLENSKEIGTSVELIGEIADQTNMLALNARIEAARAGEAGKGFAVIAEQVRELADRSRKATQEVAALVSAVQKGINEAVAAMDKITAETEQGTELVGNAGDVLGQIIRQIENTISPIKDISEVVASVSEKTGDVVQTINKVADAANNNATASQEAAGRTIEVNNAVLEVSNSVLANVDAAKEVGRRTEEISASTEDEAATAKQLSQTASELERLVSQFHT